MRGFTSYLLAGFVVVLAMDLIAPPIGLGMSLVAWPAAKEAPIVQIVNRTHKGDRLQVLQVPTASDHQKAPSVAPATLVGCEPVFSSLSANAKLNFAGRCLA
jgi:hypothetical protein